MLLSFGDVCGLTKYRCAKVINEIIDKTLIRTMDVLCLAVVSGTF